MVVLSANLVALVALFAGTVSADLYQPKPPVRSHSRSLASVSTSVPVPTSTASATSAHASTTSAAASSSAAPSSSYPAIPEPSVAPTGKWVAAYAKAKAAVSKLTLDEQIALGTGIGWQVGLCVGNTAAIPSIHFPGLCLQDSPLGVRFGTNTSVFPAGINAAATFNRDLIYKRGVGLGQEFRGKGVNVALGPDMNFIRAPRAGRAWETLGADPYLSGEAAYQAVAGLQSVGVQACAKHFLDYEQETNRNDYSSVVDDRTEHEIYLHPFLKSVQAGVASVMCSYNQVNGTYSCENDHLLNDLLKTELGFQGYVMTDWWVNQSEFGALAANKGLDMVMPGEEGYGETGTTYFGPTLEAAVNNGSVSAARVQNMATRILASWYLVGQDNAGYPPITIANATNVVGDHGALIRSIGAASTVLLKNVNNALPLTKPKTIAIIGTDAANNPAGPNACADRSCDVGILAVGWGSGTGNFPYLVDPLSAITAKAATFGATISSSINDTNLAAAATTAAGKAVAMVFVNADSGEGYLTVEGNAGDRNDLNLWHGGDALIAAVAAVNPNTIVVVHAVDPVIMEAWIDHPNITAVVWAGLQGQEAGNSLVDILWGAVNPSGRLPYTIGKKESDYPADISTSLTIPYSEGVFLDYRWFDKQGIAPRFEFGFGLSYTTFKYADLIVERPYFTGGYKAPTGAGSSLSSWLQDDWMNVLIRLTNTGRVHGTEIPQLYISFPEAAANPPNVLRGFESVALFPGASTLVNFPLNRYNFAVWNTAAQQWQITPGKYTIWVGASSRDKKLSTTITL